MVNCMKKILEWIDPVDLAKKISDNYHEQSWIFLYSGLHDEIKNSRSIIALFPKNELILDDLEEIKESDESLFGFVSYEYNHDEKTNDSFINLPKIYLVNYSLILEFDHDEKLLEATYESLSQLDSILNYQKKNSATEIKVTNLFSNFTDEEYLKTIDETKKMIACGDFYQMNLTRKFFGEFNLQSQNEFFDLFMQLGQSSPANYSAFLKLHENYIISSSPELFIQIENGKIISRPIKGTAPRGKDFVQDEINKKTLQNSVKEKAENLMIVDLVRNDLSRICKAGSVEVKNLFHVDTYQTLHHMSSEIIGEIANEFDAIDAVTASFPPGSMTGAPKIKAMFVIAQKEKLNRGVYSGAIGHISAGKANLSVVIRTLICQKNKFEFQVGGAITFDSDPNKELQEIYIKAKAIMKILNLP